MTLRPKSRLMFLCKFNYCFFFGGLFTKTTSGKKNSRYLSEAEVYQNLFQDNAGAISKTIVKKPNYRTQSITGLKLSRGKPF